ncbi:hypothetical protein GGH94_003743 [Coemansia aciculifera]|uniref:RING-type E3 ubiquitin transferase n=2 Tax=Coemansia TaxID=4863 RepID=A0A9W8IQK4_9FUNG|nr:hypothetical protein GGH94_003743 [Coemansia aciculifera]
MPETIPKSIIVRQMLSNVTRTILVATRATLVMAVWFLVLPYIVYWMTRFYFWSGGQSSALIADDNADNLNNAAEAVVYAVGSASVRFVGFSSWHEWYQFARTNNTLTPIVSRTGVLDGATSVALILYTLTRLVIKPSSQVLSNALGVRVSDEWIDEAVDSVAELTAKCIEGGVVTVVTIVLFMALFILRDWIYANAPVQENFVDEPVVEVQAPEPHAPEPELLPPPPPNVVHAQPVVVENPHYRPLFERLALLDDHQPDEQPMPIRRHSVSNSSNSSNSSSSSSQPGPSTSARNHDSFGLQDDEYADEADNAWSLVSSNESSSQGTTFMARDAGSTPPPPPPPPPAFTSEDSRGIAARVGFHPPSDSSSDSGNGGEADDEDVRWRDALHQRMRREHYEELLDFDLGMQPNAQRDEEHAEEVAEPVLIAAEPEPEPVAIAPAAVDDEDNFGDVEMGEGMLEAMGFRGRVMDSAQYFVLVLSMVSLVLACLAWIPFIIGRGFVSLNPIRWALYAVYVCTTAVDTVSEFVLDRLLPIAEICANMLGPVLVFLVPGMREALQADVKLWDQLGSATVRGAVLQRVQQSWAMQVLFPWVSASVTPTPTMADIAVLDSAYLSGVTGGERDVWRRFVRWGVPVDSAAEWLQRATGGATLGERLAMIGAGHVVLIALAWVLVAHAPRSLRRTMTYAQARIVVLMAKIAYFIFVELALFPALCGYCMAASVGPVLQPGLWAGGGWSWTRIVVYWMVGLGFMIHFARFVLYCRKVLRPGVLWFIRDPNDPEFHPMREILEDRMVPQQYKIGRSAIMYCGIITACVLVPAHMAARVAPEGMLPITWDSLAARQLGGSSLPSHTYAWVAFMLPIAFAWGKPFAVAQAVFDRWWRVAACVARLSEFMLGERDIMDEGRWVVPAARWLPSCVARAWAPTEAVRAAFAELRYLDEARAGPVEFALPTREYRDHLQAAIDQALVGSSVVFVLDGSNLRVPAIDTVPVVAGRRMLVPVDEHGRPVNTRHDYEAADHPDVRASGLVDPALLPAPAPESSYRDQRFKREDHTVVYAPPALRLHLGMFIALGWIAIAAVGVAVLMLALAVGRAVCHRINVDDSTSNVFALGVGILCVVMGCAVAVRATELVAAIANTDGEGNAAAIIRGGRRAWTAFWKISVVCAAFLGAVPLAYGLVIEAYVVVVFRRMLESPDAPMGRGLVAAMVHNWMFSLVHVWIAHSVLRFYPDWRLSQELDRLFTGAPHEWHVWRALWVFAIPAILASLAIAAVPFALAAAMLWRYGQLTTENFARIVALDDIALLAFASKTFLLSCVASAAVWHACLLYKRWTRLARDRVYLVGQRLHNLQANGPVDEYEAVAGETILVN